VYATQIIARYGCGSTLITDQGRTFTSQFIQKTCKILEIKKVQTSAYHAMSNGMVERNHKSLHDGMSHYVNATGTNWDTVVQFFLMAYRATPHGTTR
jgi:transposase InsO family protein